MKSFGLGGYALSGGVTAVLLAGCGGGSGMPLSPSRAGVTQERTHARPAYSVLYSFGSGFADGAWPLAGLLNVNGTLYGTTEIFGSGSCRIGSGVSGCGTVFAITTSGKETVLDSFNGKNGEFPFAGLTNINGTLYGTTYEGGAKKKGAVFAITTSGKETVLHSFAGSPADGEHPAAGPIDLKGTLYGTTETGGANNGGTVFAITTSGKETVLHSFGSFGSGTDGAGPEAGLLSVKNTLYGTTHDGGANGVGTIFAITASGTETVLHSFGPYGSQDGVYPTAGLIDVNGTLYGTTGGGGTSCSSSGGCGTVFSVTTSGKETVLYSFRGEPDGEFPVAGLLNVKGTLYGTTADGGARCSPRGCGTVFAITLSGAETVLHTFRRIDGEYPAASLIDVNGTLYGTTVYGGADGGGTVFSLSP